MTVFLHQDHFSVSSHPAMMTTNEYKPSFLLPPPPRPHDYGSSSHNNHVLHDVAGLDCSAHGGPSNDLAQEMVYWRDLPKDSAFVSPFHDKQTRRYLTFEPDGGGWNNIRMSMETVLTMAVATGRVLVLPPSQKMYLLGSSHFDFADFFPLHEIANEHPGLEVITTKQFLEETYGKVYINNEPAYPPQNKTDWNGDTTGVHNVLGPWLREISHNVDWNPETCLAAFPKTQNEEGTLKNVFASLDNRQQNNKDSFQTFINHPTEVNASLSDRMEEFLANRHEICLYDHELQQVPIIHFAGKRKLAGGRLLVHFYAFLFFADWKEDLWMKRFVRDHVRYIDDIQCAAARIVAAVRERARKNNDNPEGLFDSFHIRRGDFQYKRTRVEAKEILEVAMDQIPRGTTVYVATDERKKAFFSDMDNYWDVQYMDDYMHLLEGIDPNYYGMIDQLIASRGRTFFGCWFSTFTGYIMRLRGYHSQIAKAPEGYELGLLPTSFYYALADHKTKMHDYWPVKKLFYAREYPISWRSIDFDVDNR